MTRWLLCALLFTTPALAGGDFSATALWSSWQQQHFVEAAAACLRPDDLYRELDRLEASHSNELAVEEIGRSVLDRPIFQLTFGQGPKKVLLWSQMHGDEPSATPALLDLADFLVRHRGEPAVDHILGELTLVLVPMLNPDGAEVYSRRNAQAIDINRDALTLASPEGRLLRELQRRHQPILALNLHDQNRRRTVGDTTTLATMSVLAVTADAERTWTPGRLLAKRAAAAIATSAQVIFPGGVGRFDDSFSPRAFGDNISAWGSPVVLVESGGLPPGRDPRELQQLNFVVLANLLDALARHGLEEQPHEPYDTLGENNLGTWVDTLVRGGSVWLPATATTYPADLAFDTLASDRLVATCADDNDPAPARLVEVGDGQFLAAGTTINATGRVVLAPWTVAARGLRARAWLDSEGLAHLAKLGVAEVEWTVPERHLGAALAFVRSNGARPAVDIRPGTREAPAETLTLTRRPEAPKSSRLADHLAALVASSHERGVAADPTALLRRLALDRQAPTFEPGDPASFLLLDSADLTSARVVGIWSHGQEVGGGR